VSNILPFLQLHICFRDTTGIFAVWKNRPRKFSSLMLHETFEPFEWDRPVEYSFMSGKIRFRFMSVGYLSAHSNCFRLWLSFPATNQRVEVTTDITNGWLEEHVWDGRCEIPIPRLGFSEPNEKRVTDNGGNWSQLPIAVAPAGERWWGHNGGITFVTRVLRGGFQGILADVKRIVYVLMICLEWQKENER
jgi:hypothetical protein